MAKRKRRDQAYPDDRQIRYARAIGLLFCIGGFLAIGFGWSGAARRDCVDCQVPFLLSGGAAGLGLIVFGSALLVMAQLRSDSRRIGARLEEVTAMLSREADREASSQPGGSVIAGTSTYHRPDCRLLAGKAGLDVLSVARARERGLSPCRVCAPPDGGPAEGDAQRPEGRVAAEAPKVEAPSP